MSKRLIQVYTGNGKGKTTAALGLAIRARGHGLKVGFISFFKYPEVFGYGEYKALEKLGIKYFNFAKKHPHFYKNIAFDEVREECLRGLEFVKELFKDDSWDMLILDELNIALRDGFLKKEEVLSILEEKPKKLELVLTGRGAPEGIVNKVDLVSKVEEVKHPYEQGIKRRRGIEY